MPNEAPSYHKQATKKAVHLLGILLEIQLITLTSIQNVKEIVSSPSSHWIEKKGFKRPLWFSIILSATQLNYFLLDLTYPWGLVHTIPWMTLLNHFTIAKCKYLRKYPTQPTMLWEHPPRKIFLSHDLLLFQILQNAMLHCRAMLILWINISDHPETPHSSWLQLDV